MNPPVTVLIPTIGRVDMLRDCLASVLANSVLPDEILVPDQSGGSEVVRMCEALESPVPIRVVPNPGRSVATNMNEGLRSATTELVLVTHDDCTVANDWVQRATAAVQALPGGIVTGKVLPGGSDPAAVPSTIVSDRPHDFSGTLAHGALYPNNMAFHRSALLSIGGFDERAGLAKSEDLDLSWRWLRSGRPLRYDPTMVTTHNDWRSPRELAALYRDYARYAGRFYGKHLVARDAKIARFALRDVFWGLRAWVRHIARPSPIWKDQLVWLPVFVPLGIVEGAIESWRLRHADQRWV